jgi:hypothetical protein
MATKTKLTKWQKVEKATEEANLIAFDGCHKIYVAMDEVEAEWFNNRPDYTKFQGTPEEMYAQLTKWYNESCSLKMVDSVKNINGETKFTKLIPQNF